MALAKIRSWQKDSPLLAQKIDQAIQAIKWGATGRYFRPIVFGCTESQDFPVAVYQADLRLDLTVISVPAWNRMSLESQTGVVLKEALRFLELELNDELFLGEFQTERTENILSQLVTTIIFRAPNQTTSPESQLLQIFKKFGISPKLRDWSSVNQEILRMCSSLRRISSQLRQELKNCSSIQFSASPEAKNANKEQLRKFYDVLSAFHRVYFPNGDDRRKDLDGAYYNLENLHSKILAKLATDSFQDPKNLSALNTLNRIAAENEPCAYTRPGSRCRVVSYDNIALIAEALFTNQMSQSVAREIERRATFYRSSENPMFRP